MSFSPLSPPPPSECPFEDLTHNYKSRRTWIGWLLNGVVSLFTVMALIPLVIILGYLVVQGIDALNWQAFTELPPPPLVEGGGFGNALVGTLIMVGLGMAVSVPVGVMAAIYLSEFSGDKLAEWVRFATNVLSGVPSIIVGVFAYAVIVQTTKQYSAWAGGFALSILMLPIVVRTTDEALQLVPQQIRQASYGVGANHFQTVMFVVVPSAIPAIITGVTLSVARAAGETAPLLFTALFTQYWPNWGELLMEPTASLSVLVYNFAIAPFKNQQELAWAASFVLVMMVLITSIASRLATSFRKY